MLSIKILIPEQTLTLLKGEKVLKHYSISTGKNGVGEQRGSEQTPRGMHQIRAKIGKDCMENTIFVARRPTGEIYSRHLAEISSPRDWILTRILWLSGLELGKNRLGRVDTMRRYIYIHGSPDEVEMGTPGSRGCIRMRNKDIIELFDSIKVGDQVLIET